MKGLDEGKGMYFFFIKSEAKTTGGLLARPALTSYYKSSYFKERPYDPYNVYTSPNQTILCQDAYQSMFTLVLIRQSSKSGLSIAKEERPISPSPRKSVRWTTCYTGNFASTPKHLEAFDSQLIEYTSYADTGTIPGHYVLYWELRFNTKAIEVPSSVFEDCCLTAEESLNSVCRQGRASDKSIGPLEIRVLEIRVVEEGTFNELMDYALSRGASINQYKAPRCIKFTPIVELLNSRVVHSYFSPQPPQWAPGCRNWA